MHDEEHDGPYDVDGVLYCGRCHSWYNNPADHGAPALSEQPRTAAGDVVEQGSEEPIDWDAAKASSESWAKGRPLPHDLKCTPAQETLGRAYVALRAEVENWRNESLPAKLIDALRTENERLYGKVQGHGLVLAERDALRAELAAARDEIAKLRKFVSEAMHEADAEKARADKAEQRVRELEARLAEAEPWRRRYRELRDDIAAKEHARVSKGKNPRRARQEQKEGLQ